MARRGFGSVIARPGRSGLYLRLRYRGRQVVRAAGTTKKTVARVLLSKIESELALRGDLDEALDRVLGTTRNRVPIATVTPVADAPSFVSVGLRYLAVSANDHRSSTNEENKTRFDVISQAPWASKPIDRVTKGEIVTWLDEICSTRKEGRGLSPATRNRYLALISVVFNFALDRELVETNPVSGVKRGKEGRREEYFEPEELVSLLEHCPEELRILVLTAATTGLRQGVLRQICWKDVDLDKGTMLARASYAKSAKPQLIHLVPEVVQGLQDLRSRMKVKHIGGYDAVFRTKTGRPWSRTWLCQLMRRTVDTCPGIPEEKRKKVSFHTLRHSFASLLMLDGMSPRKLQEALAHSDPKLTSRYSHLNSESMREVQIRIAKLIRPDPPEEVREGYHRGYQPAVGE